MDLDDQIRVRIDTPGKEAGAKAAEASNRSLSDYMRLLLAEAVEQKRKI